MSRRIVLIDSSAWIAHLTGQPSTFAGIVQQLLLPAHRAAINSIIRVEVLTGAHDEAQYAELEDQLRGLRMLGLSDPVWRLAEQLRFQLRRLGRLIPVPDMVIASCAIVHGCQLLHADRHFDFIARHAPLKIFKANPRALR